MIPNRTPSGAFVRSNQKGQLEAELGSVGSVCVHLDCDTDCPGQVFPYTTRGGIVDNAMTVSELERVLVVYGELITIARAEWPRYFREAVAA